MRRFWILVGALALLPALQAAAADPTFSTGAVASYSPCGVGPNLPATIPEANDFATWLSAAGLPSVSRWTDGNVWGSDFRDGTDLDPGGGSDAPNIYFYTGHGICQNPPTATDGDFITVCGNFGKPDTTTIGTSTRWGNSGGHLQFGLLDASCPMDLISLSNQWFPVLDGVHVATGHSGTGTSDTLDSERRGNDFASLISGPFWFFPKQSVGDAWMNAGTEDIQSGCCAVVIAAGVDRNDAINRRDNEKITDGMSNPTPNWAAWRWSCR
jgi:hypothetical protein